MARSKKRVYYIAKDTSAIRARYEGILARNAERNTLSDPLVQLAEDLGIKIGEDLQSTGPLQNLLEGKRVTEESKILFETKLGLNFVRERVPITGRPKRICILEDMIQNGAKIGIIAEHDPAIEKHSTTTKTALAVQEKLISEGVNSIQIKWMTHTESIGAFDNGLHLLIGSAILDKNAKNLLSQKHTESIGVILNENVDPSGSIFILSQTAEEEAIRNLPLDYTRIIAVSFYTPLSGYKRMFDCVESGVCHAAIANKAAIEGRICQTNGNTNIKAITQIEKVDVWLRQTCDLKLQKRFSKPILNTGIHIPNSSKEYNYDKIIKMTKSI